MNTNIKNKIIELAHRTPDVEICGYIYYTPDNKLHLYPGRNIAINPYDQFEIDPVDYIQCDNMGVIVGVYHSHPGSEETFSEADIEYIQEIGVPLYLYTVGTGKWQEYIPPTHEIDLVGLPFIWGLYDCYSIIRNGLRQRCGVFIGDYDRIETFGRDESSKSLVLDHLALEGGQVIGHGRKDINLLRPNDIIIFNSRALPIHFGLYEGNSMFIHHPENVLSNRQQLNDSWLNRINLIVRHKNLES